MKYTAVGCHVFAGGFTMGVKRLMTVNEQLECHGFGLETARDVVGVECINCASEDWPKRSGHMLFGNPRCTGFSSITGGYDDDTHGPWAKQTVDIHQLVDYGIANSFETIVWESVQQAFTTGHDLIKYLVEEKFAPAGYRIAHLFLNAASFGNSQNRKRYFFVAYKRGKNFNIVPPNIDHYYETVRSAIWDLRDRQTNEMESPHVYDRDSYIKLTPNEKAVLGRLPSGWNLNMLVKYDYDAMPDDFKLKWDVRNSAMPFSMHCIHRLQWMRPFPTIHSNASRFIHPWRDRPITVGECATAMGWGDAIPAGPKPFAQIAKGIVPDLGEWLTQQVIRYLDDEWGDEDWESSYCPVSGEWRGGDVDGALEKTFDLTTYCGRVLRDSTHGQDVRRQRVLFNFDRYTGERIRPWGVVKAGYKGDDRLDKIIEKQGDYEDE